MLISGQAMAQAPIPLQPNLSTQPDPIPGESGSDGISVGALAEIDVSNAGLLTLENNGFGSDMWRGADALLVERLLPVLPATPSVALQNLYRRLLLSAAEIPTGWRSDASLLSIRLERLIAAGQFETAAQLAGLAGETTTDEGVLRARAEIALAENELTSACAIANTAIRSSTATYWLKLSGFCHVLNGNAEAAQLAAALVAEQAPEDAGYQNLLASLIAKSGTSPAELPHLDILQIAMLRFASLPIPENLPPDTAPGVLKLIARMPGIALQQRLIAAERAEVLGALSPEELVALYSETPYSVKDRANAKDVAAKLGGARGNALMYQSVRGQDTAAAQATALSNAWSQARSSDSFATVARVNLTPARDLVPGPEMIDTAAGTARALLAAGDPAAASRWYEMAGALSASDAKAARAATELWPLMRLSQPLASMPEDSGALSAWLANLPSGEKTRKGELLLAAMQGLGFTVADSDWTDLLVAKERSQPAEMPSAAMLHLLKSSADSGKTAQTVLLGLSAAGQNAEGLAQPVLLEALLRALSQLGLHTEARILAVETALRAGI